MSYLLAGWINDPMMVVYEFKDDKVYSALEGSHLNKKANTLLEGSSKEELLSVVKNEWRCSICREFDNLDELESILVMLELSN